MKDILVTGVAGFIGMKTCLKLFQNDFHLNIIGIDNLNDYYDISLKEERLRIIEKNVPKHVSFKFIKCDLCNKESLNNVFENLFKNSENERIVINLAAQAGVRYSLENPDVYIDTNIKGYFNILELSKEYNVNLLIHASSSSVYGSNDKVPYNENDLVDNQVSLYGVTKRIDEQLSKLYSSLYNLNIICLRFFTVYGSYGRPDMAYYKFTQKFLKNEKIQLFNNGNCLRDFTHIDDITESIQRLLLKGIIGFEIFNIGHGDPVHLLTFVRILYDILKENNYNLKPIDYYLEFIDAQPGDVVKTYCDTSKLKNYINYVPKIRIEDGLREFVKWFKHFSNMNENSSN